MSKQHKFLFFLLLLLSQTIYAQNISFVASANAEKIDNSQYRTYLGDYFEVNFMVLNGVGKNFVAPKFKDFNILSGPNAYNMEQIINGVRQSKYGYSYTLQPKKSGRFIIEPAAVSVDGKNMQSNPLAIEVIKEENTTKNSKAAPVVLRIKTDKAKYFIGEQISLSYQVLSVVPIQNYEILNQPELKDFIVQNIQLLDNEISRERFNGKTYQVFTVEKKLLFAQKSGNIKIEPIAAHLMVETEEKAFGGISMPSTKVVAAESEAIMLQINDLPTNAPKDFAGAVGTWELAMTASKNEISTDETVAIQLNISGNGDPKRIILPKLQVSDSLEVYEPKVIEEGIGQSPNGEPMSFKKVEYLIVPKYAGTYSIQPNLTYFDTENGDYNSIKTSPMTLSVTQGSGMAKPTPSNNTDNNTLSFWQKNKKNLLLGSFILLVMGGLFFFFNRKKAIQKEEVFVPTRKEEKQEIVADVFVKKENALILAENALNQGDLSNFYKNINTTLVDFINSKFGIHKTEISESTIASKLTTLGVENHKISLIVEVLKTCNMARFAATADFSNANAVLGKTKEILTFS